MNEKSSSEGTDKRVVVGVIIAVILGFLWFGGHLDKLLEPVGLNYHECATNAFGATFCGDELKAYERKVVDPIDHAQQEAASTRDRAKRESDCEWERAEKQITGSVIPVCGY